MRLFIAFKMVKLQSTIIVYTAIESALCGLLNLILMVSLKFDIYMIIMEIIFWRYIELTGFGNFLTYVGIG